LAQSRIRKLRSIRRGFERVRCPLIKGEIDDRSILLNLQKRKVEEKILYTKV
jgi:hypothetical protein